MNSIKENIHNLTSLWQTVSEPYQAFHTYPEFNYAWLSDSEWPNRLWPKFPVRDFNLSQLRLHLMHLDLPLKVPYWETTSDDHKAAFQKEGFQPGTVQLGMSLALQPHASFPPSNLVAQRVETEALAKKWSDIFRQAFGYYIHPKQLVGKPNTYVYLYSNGSTLVGTGLLHLTGTTAGIHAVGVPPEHRRQGFAEQIMFHLLHQALELQCTQSTLQASDLGKGLYLKLGYQEDFKIYNYKLP